MKKEQFVKNYHPLAKQAGDTFHLNPVVILAQAAIESGWGTSTLATRYNNLFGITAYGKKNQYWAGDAIRLGEHSLQFRVYPEAGSSFLDYARLIRHAYPSAADMSYYPEVFAKNIAYSKYLSETNGDNRETYRHSLLSLCKTIEHYLIIET